MPRAIAGCTVLMLTIASSALAAHPYPTSPPRSRDATDVAPPPADADDEIEILDDEATTAAEPVDPTAIDDPETPTASELIAQTGADAVRWEPPLRQRTMSPDGVDDPFPDHPSRARPRDAGILLGLGASFAVASTITARATLLPDCEDQSDLTTCVLPNRAEIGLRSGRLVGTIGFAIGGAAFGAFGGRELGRVLQDHTRGDRERRRRVAVGLGTSSVVMGVAGLAVGTAAFTLGSRRSLDIAAQMDATDPTGAEAMTQAELALDEVEVARVGLMVLAASPMLLSTGIALLVHRPRREPRFALAPSFGAGQAGLQATVRF